MSHPAFTLLVALLVAAAFSLEGNRTRRERLYAAIRVFVCCMTTVVAGSWIMHLIHG